MSTWGLYRCGVGAWVSNGHSFLHCAVPHSNGHTGRSKMRCATPPFTYELQSREMGKFLVVVGPWRSLPKTDRSGIQTNQILTHQVRQIGAYKGFVDTYRMFYWSVRRSDLHCPQTAPSQFPVAYQVSRRGRGVGGARDAYNPLCPACRTLYHFTLYLDIP